MQTRIEPKIVQRTARPWWIWSIPFVFLYMVFFILRLFPIAPGMAIGCFPIPIVLSFIYWHALEEIKQSRLAESQFNKNQGVNEKTTESNGTKASLENTQSLLEALIEQLPIPVVVVSAPDTIVRYSNRAAKELLGVKDESAYIGKRMHDVQNQMTWQEYWADGTPISMDELPLIRALHGEVKHIEEYKIIREDGSVRWLQASGTPIYNHAGDMIAGLVVFPDITERKQAEETLRESDFLFRSQFNHGNIGLAITSSDKKWLRVNNRLCEMLGYSADELYTKTWVEMTHPDDVEPDIFQFNRLLNGEIDYYDMDKRFFHKDGRIVHTHLTVSCYRNDDRSVKFVIASLFDITSKKHHEGQLVQEKMFSEKLINTLPGIFYLFDKDMNMIRWNRNFELSSGFSKEEIKRRKTLDWFSTTEMKEKVTAAIECVWRDGYATVEALLAMKDGRQVPYLLSGVLFEIDGQQYLMGVGSNLEERYRAEEALRQSENRFRSIIEASPMGVHFYELDAEDRLIFTGANPASDRILGVDCTPLIGKTIAESFPPLLNTEIPYRYRLAAREGVPWHSEQIDYEDNRICGAYELFVFQTSPRRMASFFQDISERKRFELDQKRYFEEIERFNDLFVGREQRIIDLKRMVNKLCVELKQQPVFDLTQIEEASEKNVIEVPEINVQRIGGERSSIYELADLIDINEIQPLLDYFSQTFGIASAILDSAGTILVKSGWQPICTIYHRINPHTRERCTESDIGLSSLLKDRTRYSIYQCRNGLTDAASPILIDGRQAAIVFVGQFLLAPPDDSFFQRQAAEYGFDETEYMNALRQVPIVQEEKLPMILGFLSTLSELLALMGVDRIKQKKVETILEQRANELDASNRELKQQRAAAISLAEDAEKSRLEAERVQIALRESEDNLKRAQKVAHIGSWLINLVTNQIIWSLETYRIFGLAPESPVTIDLFFSFVHPDDREFVQQSWQAALLHKTYDIEHRIVVENEVKWVRELAQFEFSQDDRLLYGIGTVQDTTDKKRIELALQESKRRYDELVARIPIGVYRYRMLAAGGGTFDYVSPRFCRIHNFPSDELPQNPQSAFDTLHPDDLNRLLEANENVRKTLRDFIWDGRFIISGEVRWIHMESFPTLAENGDIIWDGILQDITVRKKIEDEKNRLEEQLRQAQKMEAVGQLAGGVAHDFNNLLQVINGYSEMALHTLSEEQRAYKYLQDVEKAGKRAAGLVSQLLAFSRRQLMKPENLDLNEVIASLLKMMGRVIGEHIRLDFIPGHPLGMVCADRNMMDQVIMNLCVNARDAMPGGGTLSIETQNVQIDLEYCGIHSDGKPGRYILVSVTDTGCGMDEDTRTKIFEPFFTTKEPGQGTGLGLATVYGIVKQHDGMIQVYSEIDKGTCFKIYLPACERTDVHVAAKVEEAVVGGTETILIAEDDEMVRNLVQQLLESVGYTVILAKDGEEGLQLFHRHANDIQLLLLDVVMPKMGGREVFDCVRKQFPSTRVLFTSGYSENAIHTNFVLEEGLDLIQKPYNRNEFLRTVRRMLDTP